MPEIIKIITANAKSKCIFCCFQIQKCLLTRKESMKQHSKIALFEKMKYILLTVLYIEARTEPSHYKIDIMTFPVFTDK